MMAMIRKAAGRIGLRRLLRNRENLLLLRIIRYRGICRALLLHFFYWASLYSIQLLGRSIHEQVLQLLLELKVLSFSCLVIVFRFVQKPFCLQRGRMLDSGATQMVALNGHVITVHSAKHADDFIACSDITENVFQLVRLSHLRHRLVRLYVSTFTKNR